jgi:protein SCO1/2
MKRLLGWVLLVLALAACSPDKPRFQSIDLTGADYALGFSLPDAKGQTRSLADFKGKVVMVFFGYTQCPDFCPTTLSEMVQVKQNLGAQGDKMQAIFITLDPERDTPELLPTYMSNFDPSFVALIPSLAELPALAKDFKIYYKKVEGAKPANYTLDHSAGTYIYDTEGHLRLYARYGLGAPALTADVEQLLK